jgi:hypothetical protein
MPHDAVCGLDPHAIDSSIDNIHNDASTRREDEAAPNRTLPSSKQGAGSFGGALCLFIRKAP